MAKKKDTTLRCDFCGRSSDEVQLMLPGLNGCICDECAERANEVAKEYLKKIKQLDVEEIDMASLPKPSEIHDFLDQYVIGQERAKKYLSVAV